jgi:hypothetical protein
MAILTNHLSNVTCEVHIPSHKLASSYTARITTYIPVPGEQFVAIAEFINALMSGR